MTTVRQSLYGLALVAALAGLLWIQHQRIQIAEGEKTLALDRAGRAEKESAQRQSAIEQLDTALQAERTAQTQLRSQQVLIRQQLHARETLIEDLQRENQELREWAVQPLPDSARRLRQRPTITGADGYQNWLSSGGALHPAGDRSPAQR